MTTELERVIEQAERDVEPSVIERLARRVGVGANAAAVFGEPVHQEGLTVIPVARVSWGFGGGGGASATNDERGEGGGGGVSVSPAGFIELKDGAADYRPIKNPAALARGVASIIVASGLATWLILRGVRGLIP